MPSLVLQAHERAQTKGLLPVPLVPVPRVRPAVAVSLRLRGGRAAPSAVLLLATRARQSGGGKASRRARARKWRPEAAQPLLFRGAFPPLPRFPVARPRCGRRLAGAAEVLLALAPEAGRTQSFSKRKVLQRRQPL